MKKERAYTAVVSYAVVSRNLPMRRTSLDLETHLITRGAGAAPTPVVVSVCNEDEHYLARVGDVDWSFLDSDLIVGVNIAFDMSSLLRHAPHLRPQILRAYAEERVIDVGLAHTLVAVSHGVPAGRTGMDALAALYLDVELDKDTWRLWYSQLEGVALEYWPEGAVKYALDDTYWPLRLLEAIEACDEHGALRLLGHLTASAWGLHEAEVEGVRTHPERARTLVGVATRRAAKVLTRLQRAGLVRTDGTKDTKRAQEAARRVWARRGEAPQFTEGGAYNTSKQVAEDSGSQILTMYAEYTGAGKMRTAARTLLEGIDLPLQTRFNACMETYRTSSSMPTGGPLVGVQMQNPWRTGGYREVFTPDDGELFVGSDYKMAELYSLAALCTQMFGFSVMGEALTSGQDLHILTGANIAGVSYEAMLARDDVKHWRQCSKALNFGIPGGLGAAKMVDYGRLGYRVVLPEDTWRGYIWDWKQYYSEVALYLKWVGQRGYPWRVDHPITGFQRGGCGFTDGANTGFQSLTAYYAKTAISRVAAARWDETSPLYGFKIWNFVHDEIILRGPAERAHAAAKELARVMCEAADEVLCGLHMESDPWVADTWSKAVEEKEGLDESGVWRLRKYIEYLRTNRPKEYEYKLRSVGAALG